MKTMRKAQRGAAMVELAISMLLIIPVFLYVLFLDDLLKFRLDQQEATVTTLWDYTIQNYDQAIPTESTSTKPPGNQSAVQKYARNTYCDHEGALDSTGAGSAIMTVSDGKGGTKQTYVDCEGSGASDHHKGNVAAHECWLGAGQQVTCSDPDKSVGVVSIASGYAGKFQQGGMYTCEARIEVQNNLIPQKFFNDGFSKVDMAKKNWQSKNSGDAHANGEAGDTSNSYVFKKSEFALLTDTWALTEKQSIDPEGTGKLQERADYIYKGQTPLSFAFKGLVYAFAAKALQEQAVLVLPNTILNTNVSIHPTDVPGHSVKQDNGNQNFYDSPFKDWAANPTEKTENARGNNYMGCPTAGTSC